MVTVVSVFLSRGVAARATLIMWPQALFRGLLVVMVAVPGRASLLGGGDCVAPVVPEPVRAGLPRLIEPVCLLLAQVVCFRDQK